jgi:hypothetical protein
MIEQKRIDMTKMIDSLVQSQSLISIDTTTPILQPMMVGYDILLTSN